MPQSGATPIQLFYSATSGTVPSSVDLLPGELALNIAEGKAYYLDNSGVVKQLAGLSGFSGASGFSGVSGFSGAAGGGGSSGVSGASGASGTSGWSGALGSSGISGTSGTSGRSGYSGVGTSGTSGFSGVSGFSGAAGGSATPGGSNTQVQFNDSGAFAGNANMTFNKTTGVLTLGKDAVVNSVDVGAGGGSGSGNTRLGPSPMVSLTTGFQNTAIGNGALSSDTTGFQNTGVGTNALQNVNVGNGNTGIGALAGYSGVSGSYNTYVGYQAGKDIRSNGGGVSGSYNTFVGVSAGLGLSGGSNSASYNTFIGSYAGYNISTGTANTFIGNAGGSGTSSGYYVTTGSKNVILGNYDGNQGGLDIRTSSNYVVLSDGDGNLRGVYDSVGNYAVGRKPIPWDGNIYQTSQAGVGTSFVGSVYNYEYCGLYSNVFNDGITDVYVNNGYAAGYFQASGTHYWTSYPNNTSGAYAFPANSTTLMTLSQAGVLTCLGVYSNTVGATNRDVYVDNTGKIGYVSSTRESKMNISDLTDVSWLYRLSPVSFNYRKKDENGNYTEEADGDVDYGLIADDTEAIKKDLCFYDDINGENVLRGIKYSKLIAPLLKTVQDQKALIDQLLTRIENLESKISS